MAKSKELKVSVKLDTRAAEKSLRLLEQRIKAVNRAVNQQSTAANKLSTAINKSVKTANKLHQTNQKAAVSANQIARGYQRSGTALNGLIKKVKQLGATYLGVMGVRAITNTTDVLVGAQNRMNYVNGGDEAATQESLDKMYVSSQKVRTSYQDMISNVSKMMTLAGGAFHDDIDNAIRFQEIMSEAYAVGGASAAEMSTSMYQLTQALGSGVLQGDELRSVREGAPLAYKAIEEFAQGVYNTTDSLKEMASTGKITSEMVVAAVMNMGSSIDTAFANTRQTFGQTFDQLKNAALYAFQPVMGMLTDALNKAIDNGLVQKFEVAFTFISKVIMILFTLIYNGVNWIADHWGLLNKIWTTNAVILGTVLLGALILNLMTVGGLAKAFILAKIEAIKAALASAASWLTLCVPLTIVLAILAAIIIVIIWVADSFVDACGIIVGVIMTAAAFIWNLIVGVVNAVLQFLWTRFVEPWIGIIEWVLNVFGGGFDSFGDGVKNLLGNIISWFLSLGQVVTRIIDAIFGTNWTGGLESLKNNILKWGKNETSITLSRELPTELSRVSYGDAYSTGYEWGASAGQWLSDKVSGSSLDAIGNKLGLDLSGVGNFPTEGISGVYEPDYSKLLGGIGDDTDKIADSMKLTQEDMEYLRKVADMEWKKEYTTANLTLDITNNNNVNSELDVFGIANKLADVLYEEIDYVANGVYA